MIVVIFMRRKKMEATDVFIIALAISDMMFSLAIHPMLIATSFGADSYQIFSSSGEWKVKVKLLHYQFGLQAATGTDSAQCSSVV